MAPISAAAATLYTYTGNPMSTITGPILPSQISLSVIFETALPTNNSINFGTSPYSFSITDGINTIDNASATGAHLAFGTDGAGNIQSWTVDVNGNIGGTPIQLLTINTSFSGQTDGMFQGTTQRRIDSSPGSWTSQTVDLPQAAVPLPASGLMLTMAAAGLVITRRTKRAA